MIRSCRIVPPHPKGALAIDKGLRETVPGVYAAEVTLPKAGPYHVAFFMDAPRVVRCFTAEVAPNPELKRSSGEPVKVEFLLKKPSLPARRESTLTFWVANSQTGEPRSGIKDIGALAIYGSGHWQKWVAAKPAREGLYELKLIPPANGVYYVYFKSRTLSLGYNKRPVLVLWASARSPDRTMTRKGRSRRAGSPSTPADPRSSRKRYRQHGDPLCRR